MRTLEDLENLAGKTVLLRSDLNVPLADGAITDDFRIRASLETLIWLLEQDAKVVVCSHLGRPKGQDAAFSMRPVETRLRELLKAELGEAAGEAAGKDAAARVEVLENLRFSEGETKNDPDFVAELIAGKDCYVNDAFGASHRAHASIVGPPQFLPSAAGRLLEREAHILGGLRENPRRPFVAILGGAKVSDKLGVVSALAQRVDSLLIGGAMAFTFLAAKGHSVGSSLCEPDFIAECTKLLEGNTQVLLPTDLIAKDPEGNAQPTGANLQEGWAGMDIGPGTAAEFADAISEAAAVFWNGPMGVFEDSRFAAGTKTIAEAVAHTSAFTVIGGGDTAAAAATFGLSEEFNHISTGGGASLELLEHGTLPGLSALSA